MTLGKTPGTEESLLAPMQHQPAPLALITRARGRERVRSWAPIAHLHGQPISSRIAPVPTQATCCFCRPSCLLLQPIHTSGKLRGDRVPLLLVALSSQGLALQGDKAQRASGGAEAGLPATMHADPSFGSGGPSSKLPSTERLLLHSRKSPMPPPRASFLGR